MLVAGHSVVRQAVAQYMSENKKTTDTVLLATYLIKQNVKVGASGKEHNFAEYVGVKGNCRLA